MGTASVAVANFATCFAAVSTVAGVKPSAAAVTETVMAAPASAAVSVYLVVVAPSIGVPLRFHW